MTDPVPDSSASTPGQMRKVRIFNHRRTGRFGFEDEPPPTDPSSDLPATSAEGLVEMRLEPPVDSLPPIDDMQVTQARPDGYNRQSLDSHPLPFADSGYVRPTAPSAIVDGNDMRQSLPPVDAVAAPREIAPEEAIDHTNSHDLRLMFPHLTEKIALRRPAESLAERQDILESAVRHLECTGEVFGDFLLIRRFPAGGFGEVWLARDTASDKNVVLKRLQPEHHENKRAFYQFDIEIEIGQRIKHPNLAPILKNGVVSGRRYFTMPEITGPSLTRVLLGKAPWPMATEDVLNALEAIGRALGFLHRAGVIHADLKPDNI